MVTLITPRKVVATATSSATLARGAHTPVDATSGALTMTLPSNAPAGVEISVEKVDASANAVTVSGTLRSATSTIPLTTQYEARTFLSDGSGSWRPTSDHRTATSLSATFKVASKFTLGVVTQLTIPTYDGTGQATHPSVVDLGGAPVSGYRYWMAFTPYPNADNAKENPCIVASNDMTTWVVPAGVTNPLVAYPGSPRYNSDTHLIYWQTKFWLYYRISGAANNQFAVINSTDGITWTAPTVVFTFADSWDSVSPAFRLVGDRILVWFVRVQSGATASYPNDVYQMESIDGITFRNPRKCTLALPGGATPWHLDVDYGTSDTGAPVFLMAANTYALGGDANHASLHFATSGDGLTFEGRGPSLTPTGGTWYDKGVYRPSILRNAAGLFRVFFGAYNASNQSHIGYADLTATWGDVHKAIAPRAQFAEQILGDAWVGSSYTVGTTKVKGNAPTLILPKATSSVSSMWKAFAVPYGVAGVAAVDIYWLVEDTLAGNIRFRVYDVDAVLGVDNLGGSQSSFAVLNLPAPGVANVVQKATMGLPLAHLQNKSLQHIRISRDGQDATDTYASDALLLGFQVRYGDVVGL